MNWRDCQQHELQADNSIGAGAKALGEALKTNTTLQSLDLFGEQEESEEDGQISDIANNKHRQGTTLEQKEQEH